MHQLFFERQVKWNCSVYEGRMPWLILPRCTRERSNTMHCRSGLGYHIVCVFAVYMILLFLAIFYSFSNGFFVLSLSIISIFAELGWCIFNFVCRSMPTSLINMPYMYYCVQKWYMYLYLSGKSSTRQATVFCGYRLFGSACVPSNITGPCVWSELSLSLIPSSVCLFLNI